jgi:ABC-type Fe3+-hydroxamate transport system substrate-binding protein
MRSLLVIVAITFFIACASSQAERKTNVTVPNKSMREAKVTLNIFSGRENPSWRLSEEQIEKLMPLLQDLPKSDNTSFDDGLGYRGFEVVLTDPVDKKVRSIVVYNGKILSKTREAEEYFNDLDRQLEAFILQTGSKYLEPEIYNLVKKEIELSKK